MIFGGVGAGLYGMLIFVVIAVFIAGLMVGRTPEYLGKKIESYDVKMVLLASARSRRSSSWASPPGRRSAIGAWPGLNNNGPHGFSEILYAYTSGAGNNGSAFAGLNANTPWYDTTLGIDMLHRPVPDDCPDAGAGRLAGAQENRSRQRRHLPGDRLTFVVAARSARSFWSAR